ncbi:O-antigen ligase family protein [Enterocloster clostridioformis]|uniref:O-antigen ligase family protein n=1 Tax=Enterocloster clostridioformis TaxID=1531 RepID=UPI00042A784E|nr:O-antigen ligase family protein [Enterocloster clostridioformis]
MKIRRPRAFFCIVLLMLYICTTSFWKYIYINSAIRYASVLLCAFLALSYIRGSYIKKDDLVTFIIAAFVLVNNQDIAHGDYFFLLIFMVSFIAYFTFRDNQDVVRIGFNCFLIAGIIYALFTFICYAFPAFYLNTVLPIFESENQYKLMISYNRGAVAGIAKHYTLNAYYILMGILVCVSRIFSEGKKNNKRYFFLAIVLFVALLLTGKRGHVIFGAAAIIVQYYYYNSDKKHGRIFKILCLTLAVMILFLILRNFIPGINLFVERFIETYESNNITMGRDALYVVAWKIFSNNPILGVGWGGFVYAYETLTGSVFAAHNIYLSLLCETGVVGFTVFVGWFIYNLYQTIKTYSSIRRKYVIDDKCLFTLNVSLSYQVLFVLLGISENPLYGVETIVPYFLSILAVKQVKRILSQGEFNAA